MGYLNFIFQKKDKTGFLLFLFFLVSLELSSQNNSVTFNQSVVNSTINIVQNGDLKTYNINDSKELSKLRKDLGSISTEFRRMMENFESELKKQRIEFSAADKKLRQSQEKISKKQDEIKLQLDQLSKNVIRFLLPDTTSITLLQFENKAKEIELNKTNLEKELASLTQVTTDSTLLFSAQKSLMLYDIDGYHKALNEIKSIVNIGIEKRKEAADERRRLFYANEHLVKNIFNDFGTKLRSLILRLEKEKELSIRLSRDKLVPDTVVEEDKLICIFTCGNPRSISQRISYGFRDNRFYIDLMFWTSLDTLERYCHCVIMNDGSLEMMQRRRSNSIGIRNQETVERVTVDQLISKIKTWILDKEAWKRISNY